MVNNTHDLVSGEMVFLSSKDTPLDTLNEVATLHNLDVHWLETTAPAALQSVLRETFLDGGNTLVRKAKGSRTYCVVREDVDEDNNTYTSTRSYRVDDNGDVTKLTSNGLHWLPKSNLSNQVANKMKMCFARRITSSLVKAMMKTFCATRVSRSAYFIPASKLEAWNKFCIDWHKMTECSISRIQSGCDENTVKAVTESARLDLAKRYDDCKKAIKENDEREATQSSKDRRKLILDAELAEIERVCKELDGSFNLAKSMLDEIKGTVDLEAALNLL